MPYTKNRFPGIRALYSIQLVLAEEYHKILFISPFSSWKTCGAIMKPYLEVNIKFRRSLFRFLLARITQ